AAGVAVLCATGVAAAVGVAFDRSLERPDWRPVARALGPAPANVGRAIFVERYGNLLPLSLYQPGLRFMPRGGALVDELDVIAVRSPRQDACWWGAACNLLPSQLQGSYPVPGFHVVGVEHVLQFTILRMRSATPVHLTRQMVSRALTPTDRRRHNGLIVEGASAPTRGAAR
ncbi:MAG: hypothetical protein M3071_03890, partial [Actinomycetota bacterium]|nr:hypothetical protein [Actinomycetota bacterium]